MKVFSISNESDYHIRTIGLEIQHVYSFDEPMVALSPAEISFLRNILNRYEYRPNGDVCASKSLQRIFAVSAKNNTYTIHLNFEIVERLETLCQIFLSSLLSHKKEQINALPLPSCIKKVMMDGLIFAYIPHSHTRVTFANNSWRKLLST